MFTRRKAYTEGSTRWKLWFSRMNKSACVWTLPCYKCAILLNQQRTEKKSFFIQINFAKAVHLMTHRHNIVLKIVLGLVLYCTSTLWRELIPNVWSTCARCTDLPPLPFFSNFRPFTNLFSITFLYFFIISSLFPYFNLLVSIFM